MFKYCIFYFIFSVQLIFSVSLNYTFTPGEILFVETNGVFNVYVNGEYTGQRVFREISYIETLSVYKNSAKMKATTYLLENQLESKQFFRFKVVKKITYTFTKDTTGKTNGLRFPIGTHDFPRFTGRDGVHNFAVGDSWDNTGFFVLPLYKETVPTTRVDTDVLYRLLQVDKQDGDQMALISANCTFTQTKKRTVLQDLALFKLGGFNNYLIKFNKTAGRIHSIEETFDYFYVLHDYTVVEMSGTSFSFYKVPPPPKIDTIEVTEKDKLIIKKNENNTISIIIENIEFEANSKILRLDQKARLDKTAKILAKYRANRILIIGHTADIGQPTNQQILSEERAKAVYRYLIEKHNFDPRLLAYEGRGGTEPLVSNTSDEGRAKNRRVEIVILPY